ncbi:MAG: SRPBCC family protein [Phycisphaeraceae bacterium]|nr:SRPBCC family protein [Phycisphaerales bacterium]MCB9861326.1 SRPBCC family protein [Phycisphaeraceae bacterium]
MADTASGNTVRLHRILRAPAEHVYKAFLDPAALCKWMAPHGFVGTVHHIDARVGGTYKMSFTNFRTGTSHSFGGTYVELTPHSTIRYVDAFDNPELSNEMSVTIQLRPVACGTELNIVQENVPPQIPVEFCYSGWQESLTLLALLIEADIPDQ